MGCPTPCPNPRPSHCESQRVICKLHHLLPSEALGDLHTCSHIWLCPCLNEASHTRQTYLLVSTWPEDSHQEHSCDGRHQKAGHWLHVVKQQAAVWHLDDWNPQEADTHQDQNENPATDMIGRFAFWPLRAVKRSSLYKILARLKSRFFSLAW